MFIPTRAVAPALPPLSSPKATSAMASKALVKAVTAARYTQTRLLLQLGADVNARDEAGDGQTAIIRAVRLADPRARASVMRLLLRAGALVSMPDWQGRNALMWACAVGSERDVRVLLRQADVELALNARDRQGRTALWTAVRGGRVEVVGEVVRELVRQGLDVDLPDHEGVTPAALAATLGHLDCLKVMVRHVHSAAKSNATLVTLAQINKALHSTAQSATLSATTTTARTACQCRDLYDSRPVLDKDRHQPPLTKPPLTKPQLPTIRTISAGGYVTLNHPSLDLRPRHPQATLLAVSVALDIPQTARTSTPVSKTHPSSHRLSSQHTGIPKTVPALVLERPQKNLTINPNHQHTHRSVTSVGNDDVRLGDNETVSARSLTWKRCVSPTDLSSVPEPSDPMDQSVVCPPVTRAAIVNGSVRDSLPALLELFAQQTTASYRKTAVRPVTPPPPKPKAATSSWSKIRGLALLTGLGKVKVNTDRTLAGSRSPDRTTGGRHSPATSQQDMSPASGLVKLLQAKRKLTAGSGVGGRTG